MSATRDNTPRRDPEPGTSDALPSDPHLDDDLHRRFAAERAHDAVTTPPFARVLAPRRQALRRRWLQPSFALGALAIVILAAGLWRRSVREDETRTSIVIVPGQMRVPTDFLLDLARNTTTRAGEVPSIGAIDWYPLQPPGDMAPTTTRRN